MLNSGIVVRPSWFLVVMSLLLILGVGDDGNSKYTLSTTLVATYLKIKSMQCQIEAMNWPFLIGN